MNPLMKNPTLARLPYKVLKNPDLSTIKKALAKRKKTLNMLKYLISLVFVWEVIKILIPYQPTPIDKLTYSYFFALDILILVLCPIAVIALHHQGRKCDIPDEVINGLIQNMGANSA